MVKFQFSDHIPEVFQEMFRAGYCYLMFLNTVFSPVVQNKHNLIVIEIPVVVPSMNFVPVNRSHPKQKLLFPYPLSGNPGSTP